MVYIGDDRIAQEDWLCQFREEYLRLWSRARELNMVPEDTTAVELGRVLLIVTAEKFRPLHPQNKKLLGYLRRYLF